jgi:pimeloyl-ACP methyl ester carboxylesterase
MWFLGSGRNETPADTDSTTVTASDGVPLHVEVVGTGGVTMVFCHGYLLDSRSWDLQRAAFGRRERLVLWDQRGHGRSGWGEPPNATVDQLGRDLFAVLQVAAPAGPVVLVGHSMGGMAILGLAESHPELFGDRVRGVALIATSAGGLSGVTLGLPVRAAHLLHQAVRSGLWVLGRQPRVVDPIRRATGVLSLRLTRRYLFGTAEPVPDATTHALASTPIAVVAEFFSELDSFDKRAAVSAVGRARTLVMVGARDRITPLNHSEELARAIPGARLVVIPEAGHLVALERSQKVNARLRRLLGDVYTSQADDTVSEHRPPAGL